MEIRLQKLESMLEAVGQPQIGLCAEQQVRSLQPIPEMDTAAPPKPQMPETLDQTLKGHTVDELKDTISHIDGLYECVHTLLLKLFDAEYIITHSDSGQRTNTSRAPKPKFDERLFGVFMTVIKSKFREMKKTDITSKVQTVQKKYFLQQKTKDSKM